MKIKDLDDSTRILVHRARVMAKWPSNKTLRSLKRSVLNFDESHEPEMCQNLIAAIWGPEGYFAKRDSETRKTAAIFDPTGEVE